MKKKINLIGISGKAGSGKNTVASIIQYLIWHSKIESKERALANYSIKGFLTNRSLSYTMSGWEQKQLAGKVKEILCLLTGCSMENLENEEFKQSFMSKEWNRWKPKGKIQERECHTTAFYATKLEALKESNKYFETDIDATEESITYRFGLQLIGTDLFRNKFHPNTWTTALFADYNDFNVYKHNTIPDIENLDKGKLITKQSQWLISDVRFPNEIKAIKDRNGILIKVNRSKLNRNRFGPVHKIEEGVTQQATMLDFSDEHESETALDEFKGWDYTIDNNGSIEDLIEKVRKILIKEKLI